MVQVQHLHKVEWSSKKLLIIYRGLRMYTYLLYSPFVLSRHRQQCVEISNFIAVTCVLCMTLSKILKNSVDYFLSLRIATKRVCILDQYATRKTLDYLSIINMTYALHVHYNCCLSRLTGRRELWRSKKLELSPPICCLL